MEQSENENSAEKLRRQTLTIKESNKEKEKEQIKTYLNFFSDEYKFIIEYVIYSYKQKALKSISHCEIDITGIEWNDKNNPVVQEYLKKLEKNIEEKLYASMTYWDRCIYYFFSYRYKIQIANQNILRALECLSNEIIKELESPPISFRNLEITPRSDSKKIIIIKM